MDNWPIPVTSCRTGIPQGGLVRFRFGRNELNTATQELHRDGQLVHVEPQVLAVLEHLIVHRERVLTKIELLDEVWGSRFVSESALTTRIKSARRAVGDTGRDQQVIRTIHGRGYRFVADLDQLPGAAPGGSFPPDPLARRAHRTGGRAHGGGGRACRRRRHGGWPEGAASGRSCRHRQVRPPRGRRRACRRPGHLAAPVGSGAAVPRRQRALLRAPRRAVPCRTRRRGGRAAGARPRRADVAGPAPLARRARRRGAAGAPTHRGHAGADAQRRRRGAPRARSREAAPPAPRGPALGGPAHARCPRGDRAASRPVAPPRPRHGAERLVTRAGPRGGGSALWPPPADRPRAASCRRGRPASGRRLRRGDCRTGSPGRGAPPERWCAAVRERDPEQLAACRPHHSG